MDEECLVRLDRYRVLLQAHPWMAALRVFVQSGDVAAALHALDELEQVLKTF